MAARHPPNYLVVIKCKNIESIFYFSKKPNTDTFSSLGIFSLTLVFFGSSDVHAQHYIYDLFHRHFAHAIMKV